MFIYQLRTVDDLEIGGRAEPEPGVRYQLRTINNVSLDVGDVAEVVRDANVLCAVTADGRAFPITGAGSLVLVPTRG
ncbi:hypothetical protein [Bremerella sp.]|uniref:hypothetical protein n=1 Tax=Bremerella sp. TaxID=2795602 RepID=UPI00391B6947